MSAGWAPFQSGESIGQSGSEGGSILVDEEHSEGARITLERMEKPRTGFAITCGIYGWMVHTRYFDEESEATRELDAMKAGLEEVLRRLPADDDEACSEFVAKFP